MTKLSLDTNYLYNNLFIFISFNLLVLYIVINFVSSSVPDESTSQTSQIEAEVRTGSTAQILPTRASEANQLPEILATTGAEETTQGSKQNKKPVKDNIKEINYEPTVEEHFSFTNDLKEGYLDLSPTKAGPGSTGAILRTSAGEEHAGPRGKVGGPTAGRKSSPDIQEIITGFVKLLNGNQPAQAGRPVRTRINNRGPPRITDLPPLVLDPPRREPPPYPFERPQGVIKPFVSGVPLPEQIVPTEPLRQPLRPVRNRTKEQDTISPTRVLPGQQPTVLGTAVSSSVQEVSSNLTAVENTTTPPSPIDTTTRPTTTNGTTTTTTPPTTTNHTTTTMRPMTSNATQPTTRTTTPDNKSTTTRSTTMKTPEQEKRKKIASSTTIEPSIVEVVTLEETKWNDTRTKGSGTLFLF